MAQAGSEPTVELPRPIDVEALMRDARAELARDPTLPARLQTARRSVSTLSSPELEHNPRLSADEVESRFQRLCALVEGRLAVDPLLSVLDVYRSGNPLFAAASSVAVNELDVRRPECLL